MVVMAAGESGTRQLIEGVDYTLNTPASGGWRMYFVGANSPSPFNEDTTLTFTYTIPLDAIVAYGQSQMTMKEALQNFERAEIGYQSNSQNWFYLYNPISLFIGVSGGAIIAFTDIRWPIHKIAEVDGEIVKYQLYINSVDMMFLYSNILRDVFDENVEYVPFSFNIMPDGAGGKRYGPYESPGGVFTDMLAESIIGNEFETNFTAMRHVNVVDGLATGFASAEMMHELIVQNTYYIVEYQMQVRDGLIDQHLLKNTVDINGFDYTAEALYGNKVVDKTMVATSNTAVVTVYINPDEARLAEDGKYTIIDTQSDTLAFYLGTVVLKAWENGAWVEKPLVNSDSGELWTWMLIGSNELHIVVPDETSLMLTYSTLIRGEAGQTVDIYNSIVVAEEYTDYTEDSFYISDTHGSSSGDRRRVAVLKNDADNPTIFLFGSVFALYVGYPYAGWEEVPLPPGLERTFLVGQTTFYYLAMETSIADGAVFDDAWLTPTHKFIYAVLEVSPPPGYLLPDDPITLFTYTPPTPEQLEALGPKGNELVQISDNITISNTRIEFEPIFVELLMSKNAVGAPMVGGEFDFAIFDQDDIQVNFASNNQSGLITFDPMEFTEPGIYEYTVKETYAPTGWTQDTGEWPIVIEITLIDGELHAGVSYPSGIPGFVNTYEGEECSMIEFSFLDFDAPGIYEFTLKELTQSGGGWITDDDEFRVIVEVIDDGHGNLIATISYPDGFPAFTNTYAPAPICVIFSARKTAVGAPLPCGRFTFGLYNEAGELISSATNGPGPAPN
jgi:pilin isopeptide linkage protein